MSTRYPRIIIVIFLLLIVGSLVSALYYLVKDKGGSDRTAKALTLRRTLRHPILAADGRLLFRDHSRTALRYA